MQPGRRLVLFALTTAGALPAAALADGKLVDRVLSEAMPGGRVPQYVAKVMRSAPGANGSVTVLDYQLVGDTPNFDAAGFAVGLSDGAPDIKGADAKQRGPSGRA